MQNQDVFHMQFQDQWMVSASQMLCQGMTDGFIPCRPCLAPETDDQMAPGRWKKSYVHSSNQRSCNVLCAFWPRSLHVLCHYTNHTAQKSKQWLKIYFILGLKSFCFFFFFFFKSVYLVSIKNISISKLNQIHLIKDSPDIIDTISTVRSVTFTF